jgi:predicted fused transcriptional regulator/phosphomethylpyrimidine kinase
MAENTIEIEVELVGQDDTLKGLDNVKEGAKGIGETFKGVGSIVGQTNNRMGEGLSTLSDAFGESIDAISEMGSALATVGQGGAGITALLGPLALLVSAASVAYEGIRQLSGAAEAAENRQEALGAAASDLTAKLEALAEGGVIPAGKALSDYAKSTLLTQFSKELLTKQSEKMIKVIEKEVKAQERLNGLMAIHRDMVLKGTGSAKGLEQVTRSLEQAQIEYNETLSATQALMKPYLAGFERMLQAVSEQGKVTKELEEATTDNLKAKAKEQEERLKSLLTIHAENQEIDKAALVRAKETIALLSANNARKIEDMDRSRLISTVKAQEAAIKGLVGAKVEEIAVERKVKEIEDSQRKARRDAYLRRKTQQEALAKQQETRALQQIARDSQLRQLQIQYTLEGDAQLLALARERYDTGLQLAKDDATKRAIVETQYRLEVRKIQEAELDRDVAALDARLAKEKEAAQALRDFRFETAEFNASMIRDEGERELALLQVKYDKELALAQDNQMKRTELQRRYGLERARLEQQSAAKMQEVAEKLLDDYGKGFAQASVGALMFGENFEESIAKVTKSLAMEAGVQALMELAKGTAALLLNPVQASTHFKSAALFGSAALLAKGASSALGGGGGGATGTASPSGSALSAPAPQRQSAEQESMVFNINFGGAVIYDTRRAAEEALADRVATVFNRPRRGAVRPVMMRG